MFQQLVNRMSSTPHNIPLSTAADMVLGADPFDLVLHMEQIWHIYNPWSPNPGPAGQARQNTWVNGAFHKFRPTLPNYPTWDHLGYSYLIENTRAVQIFQRVIQAYRAGEGLGFPSVPTQRWIDATEALLYGAANPVSPWLSTSNLRRDPERVRRNANWRLFGMEFPFGDENNQPVVYDKAKAHNQNFLRLLEELLFECWQAMSNYRNSSGSNPADDDRIFRLAEELKFMMRSRRQSQQLMREELAASAVASWIDLTLATNTPLVMDLRAEATDPADRLAIIGERVDLRPHSKSSEFFAMASEFSLLLRTIESGVVSDASFSWVLYRPTGSGPNGIGTQVRRVITEWASATGKDLKSRGKPVELGIRRVAA